MKRYKTLLFDLFNTVALWQPERMPQFTWDGETRPSTLGELAQLLAEQAPQIVLPDFYAALTATNKELANERAHNLQEVSSHQRFARALTRVGLASNERTTQLAQELSLRHMAILANASQVPAAHASVLARLSQRYPLALVSNFDHAPTALAIVQRDGVAAYFQELVISDSHGWRKPHARIFKDTLDALGFAASEALFIGDSLEDDVIGASAAGIDIAWINAKAQALPAGLPRPTFTLSAITELESAVNL